MLTVARAGEAVGTRTLSNAPGGRKNWQDLWEGNLVVTCQNFKWAYLQCSDTISRIQSYVQWVCVKTCHFCNSCENDKLETTWMPIN